MSEPKLEFGTYEPATLTIAGVEIALRIKRQDVGEAADFDRLFFRAMNPEADRLILVRRPGEEMERVERVVLSADRVNAYRASVALIQAAQTGTLEAATAAAESVAMIANQILNEIQPSEQFVIDDEEIKRRRRLEMTDQERANYERVQAADRAAFEANVRKGLDAYVRVVPGQITLVDEDTGERVDVRTGAQLSRCIGSENGLLFRLLLLIREVNTLGDRAKNGSGSHSISSSSSSGRDPKASGAPPAAAPTVAPPDSATTAAVTPSEPSPSGSMVM